jgi:undecaprenyl-diphosphatase
MIRDFYGWLRHSDLIVLIACLVVVLGVWGFVELTDEVREGDTQRFDDWMVLALRNPDDLKDPLGPRWLEEMGRDLTALGGIAFLSLLSAAVVLFLLMCRKYHEMWLVVIATVGALVLSSLLKGVIDRPRPQLVPTYSHVYSASFPSGHSMLSAAVYLTLGALLGQLVQSRRLKTYFLIVALLLTFLVGISRIYLGVHFPTDVLAGWSMGLTWAISCWLVARYLRERGAITKINE